MCIVDFLTFLISHFFIEVVHTLPSGVAWQGIDLPPILLKSSATSMDHATASATDSSSMDEALLYVWESGYSAKNGAGEPLQKT